MTRQQAQQIREVFNAFCDGKEIEVRGHIKGLWTHLKEPEPQYRPFTAEEVPVGALIRKIDKQHSKYITYVIVACTTYEHQEACVRIVEDSGIRTYPISHFTCWEYSLDQGKTWQPFGVKI